MDFVYLKAKIAVFSILFELHTTVENFLDDIAPWYVYVKSSTNIGLHVEQNITLSHGAKPSQSKLMDQNAKIGPWIKLFGMILYISLKMAIFSTFSANCSQKNVP